LKPCLNVRSSEKTLMSPALVEKISDRIVRRLIRP
jgi:hypothetical protein